MADAFIGQGCTRELRIEDTGGVPVTDATVTYTLTDPAGGALVTAAAAPHTGDGWYSYSVAGSLLTLVGRYDELWAGTSGTTALPWHSGFQVEYGEGPALTRWELRHRIARLCDDLWLGTVASATATTLVDTERTLEPNNHWRGDNLYLYGGTGRGQERTILSSTQSSGTLTIGTPWSPAPAAATRYEVHKKWRVSDYNDAINLAIAEVAREALLPATDESITLAATTYEYALPADLRRVQAVWWRDPAEPQADWYPLAYAQGDWRLVPGRRAIWVRAPSANARLRIVGQRRPLPVERDASFVPVDDAYLAYAAAAILHMQRVTGQATDTDASLAKAKMFADTAEAYRPNGRPWTGSKRV